MAIEFDGETQLRRPVGLLQTLRLLIGPYRKRATVCMCLMTAQAVFYNSVFLSLTLVLMRYYGASAARVGYVFLHIAFANFLGPLLLGRLFDTIGRRQMTGGSFIASGVLLLVGGLLFWLEMLNIVSQVTCWSIIFFVASASASAAYLSASELFPQEVRASAIAIFYAAGTLLGGTTTATRQGVPEWSPAAWPRLSLPPFALFSPAQMRMLS